LEHDVEDSSPTVTAKDDSASEKPAETIHAPTSTDPVEKK
jgi:hypothetical protein